MRRSRNPDLIGDLLLTGAVLGGMYLMATKLGQVKLGQVKITLPSIQLPPIQWPPTNPQGVIEGIQQGVNDVLGTGVLPGGVSTDKLCQSIAIWKHNQVVFNPLHWIFPPADPNDWDAFRTSAKQPIIGLGYDPGPTPPACWSGTYTAGTANEPTYYETQRPGGLGY